MRRIKTMRHNGFGKPWRAICHKHTPCRNGWAKRHPRLDIIRYTKAFSKTKRRVFRYPKFNDVDYPPEVLREAYNASAWVCENLANAKEFGNAKAMKWRINEAMGDLHNIISALGKVKGKH